MSNKLFCKIYILLAILILLVIIGSFYDFEIAKISYFGENVSDNIFGIIFSYIGIIPTFVGWSFLGASIFYLSKNANKRKWLRVLSIFLLLLSFLYFCNTLMLVNERAFSVHWAIAYPLGLIIILIAIYLGYILSKKSDNKELLSKILFYTFVSLMMMVFTMTTKEIMARPRYRFVYEMNNSSYFRNWWQSGHDIKNSINISALNDEFSSLPSGHSSFSMFAIFMFPLLGKYIKVLEKHKNKLFFIGILWWFFTAFSRMTLGAHYLSDVCFGGIITLLSYFIIKIIYQKSGHFLRL